MAQGIYKKRLAKWSRKGTRGYPVATIAYYGATNVAATKLVCAIVQHQHAEPTTIEKWFSKTDIRKSEAVLKQVFAFIKQHEPKSVVMLDKVIGCPHEEGIDYPENETCPQCPYWKNRDRFTHQRLP